MSPPYAEDTSVPAEQSKAEIERILARYGADQFASGWSSGQATFAFQMNGRRIRFNLPLPHRKDPIIMSTPSGKERTGQALEDAVAKELRRRWRAMALVIKAKLEAVQSGITEFEEEFMAHIVMPNGKTVGELVRPQIESVYKSGKSGPLLLGFDKEAN